MKKINFYFDGKPIKDGHTKALGRRFEEMDIKIGDVFEYYPFNYFDNEDTAYKSEKHPYQTIELVVVDKTIRFIDDWNSGVKVEIDYFIERKSTMMD